MCNARQEYTNEHLQRVRTEGKRVSEREGERVGGRDGERKESESG